MVRKKALSKKKEEIEKIDWSSLVSPIWVENLKWIKKDVIENDYDALFVVSGYEGNGKSTFTFITCKNLNEDHNNDTIFFKKHEWDKQKRKLKKGDTAQFTEGTEFAMSKDAMTLEVKQFEKEITQWRGRNLFLFMEISDLDMLSKYLRKSRALGLIWIPRRGVAWVYSFIVRNAKDAERVHKLKQMIYRNEFPRPDLRLKFKGIPPHDPEWKTYSKRKQGFMKEEKESKAVRKAREKIEKRLDGSMTIRDIATVYDITTTTVRTWLVGNKKYKPKVAKSHLFKDFAGRVRLDKKGVQMLDRRVKKDKKF